MTIDSDGMDVPARSELLFVLEVRKAFGFLNEAGFEEIEASPTLVRYRKEDVEVDVYHGRQSYEIGCGVTISGTRYAISELIRSHDPEAGKAYRNAVAKTAGGVAVGLRDLSALVQRYGALVLSGDPMQVSKLVDERKRWAQEYALDVLVAQLRPQADDAFRRGEYATAAELFGRIRERLSPAEVKKLLLAQKHLRS
jgi:hypothetical protein